MIPVLPNEIADLLDDATVAEVAASDATVDAFLAEHQQNSRPGLLAGWVKALSGHFTTGDSRHMSTVSVLAGACKESRAGYFPAPVAVEAIRAMFLDAVAQEPISSKQGEPRTGAAALSEFNDILSWVIGQALAANLDEVRARADDKMYDNQAWAKATDYNDYVVGAGNGQVPTVNVDPRAADGHGTEDDEKTVPTVPWPALSDAALHGAAGNIVKLVALHTEADPAAILVQTMAVFGAAIGTAPHIIVGNERHRASIHPLIVGRTNSGAKGTGLAVVEAIRRRALPWFDEFTASGLSSAEGLIEQVRDASGDPENKDYDPGVADKRLLIKETEYRSVLERCKREGNTLGMTLRQAWDGGTLRTLTRKHNRLTATDPHIVVIGHITPREFRSTVADGDLAGGSINRLLICLSRRSRLHSRFGNVPEPVLAKAAKLFDDAYKEAVQRGELKFTDEFWPAWETAYRDLNRDRPDTWATDATARGVTQVLRLALIYALIDRAEMIGVEQLAAALALWGYCEHSARWLLSTYELEIERENVGGLAGFIRDGGRDGRTRTAIYRDHFKSNIKAVEINLQLTQLVHDGVVVEIKDETGPRPITRYIHRDSRINAITHYAGQALGPNTSSTHLRTDDISVDASECVDVRSAETDADLQNTSNTLERGVERETRTYSETPGAPTEHTPGMSGRVQQILANHNGHQVCGGCAEALETPESIAVGRCLECRTVAASEGAAL